MTVCQTPLSNLGHKGTNPTQNDNRGIRTLALSDQIANIDISKPDSGALDHSAILPFKDINGGSP